jgi:Arc/MetJ-type ribon-helix-helix transcriptional regulator
MKTLTVRLPEVLVAQIEAESRDRKVSKSDVVRERRGPLPVSKAPARHRLRRLPTSSVRSTACPEI